LARNEFVPPLATADAVGGPGFPGTSAARAAAFAAEVGAFAAEVGAFAAGFWDLPPTARRARWAALTARASDPAAAARLAELGPGLAVVPVTQSDAAAAAVAGLVKELFVLPPAARAARRLGWLTAAGRRDPEWVAAVRTVLRTDRPLARLDARLFDWYSGEPGPVAVAAAPEHGRPVPAGNYARVYSEPWALPSYPGRSRPPADGSRGVPAWGLGILVVVLVKIVLAVVSSTAAPSYQNPYAAPYQPSLTHPTAARPPALFTAEQVRLFREYEARQRRGAAPVGYLTWAATGRPDGR
jgi:hypothetical protein